MVWRSIWVMPHWAAEGVTANQHEELARLIDLAATHQSFDEWLIQEVVAPAIEAHVDYQLVNFMLVDVLKESGAESLERLFRIVAHLVVLYKDRLRIRQMLEPVGDLALLQIEGFGAGRLRTGVKPVAGRLACIHLQGNLVLFAIAASERERKLIVGRNQTQAIQQLWISQQVGSNE